MCSVGPMLSTAGVFAQVKPISPGACTAITGVVGAEDLQIDHAANLMFVSATDRRAKPEAPNPQDGLYVLDLAHKDLGFKKLGGTPAVFHPHGLSLYIAPDGARTLMVINHHLIGATIEALAASVEIFDVSESPEGVTLHHRASVTGDLLYALNDLVAVGKDQFYAVNQFGHRSALGVMIELYARLPDANVVFYDGEMLSIAARNLKDPTGINASPDYQMIYISEASGRRLSTFLGDPLSGRLIKSKELGIPSLIDNVDVDADGFVWVAGHPKAFALAGYGKDEAKPSPSEIWKVQILHGLPVSARRVYVNRGEEIGAASVGAVHEGHLYIGSAFDPKILDCALTGAGA